MEGAEDEDLGLGDVAEASTGDCWSAARSKERKHRRARSKGFRPCPARREGSHTKTGPLRPTLRRSDLLQFGIGRAGPVPTGPAPLRRYALFISLAASLIRNPASRRQVHSALAKSPAVAKRIGIRVERLFHHPGDITGDCHPHGRSSGSAPVTISTRSAPGCRRPRDRRPARPASARGSCSPACRADLAGRIPRLPAETAPAIPKSRTMACVVLEQDVLRLDIAMDDPLAVRVVERPGDLDGDPERELQRIVPSRKSRVRSDSPVTSGMVYQKRPSTSPAASSGTMCGWSRCAVTAISRRKCSIPTRSATSGWTILSATSRPSDRSRARNTRDMPAPGHLGSQLVVGEQGVAEAGPEAGNGQDGHTWGAEFLAHHDKWRLAVGRYWTPMHATPTYRLQTTASAPLPRLCRRLRRDSPLRFNAPLRVNGDRLNAALTAARRHRPARRAASTVSRIPMPTWPAANSRSTCSERPASSPASTRPATSSRESRAPVPRFRPILIGSHIDSVTDGGNFDGPGRVVLRNRSRALDCGSRACGCATRSRSWCGRTKRAARSAASS